MISIELLSVPGCEACVSVRRSLDQLGQEQHDLVVEEVDVSIRRDVAAHYGLMTCPALAIDGRLEAVGAVSHRKLRKMIARHREALENVAALDGTTHSGGAD